jgi:hypothetical protein
MRAPIEKAAKPMLTPSAIIAPVANSSTDQLASVAQGNAVGMVPACTGHTAADKPSTKAPRTSTGTASDENGGASSSSPAMRMLTSRYETKPAGVGPDQSITTEPPGQNIDGIDDQRRVE